MIIMNAKIKHIFYIRNFANLKNTTAFSYNFRAYLTAFSYAGGCAVGASRLAPKLGRRDAEPQFT